jgi:putative phage-type endonuclease
MNLVNIEQRSASWYAWRAAGIGASESGPIAAAAGLIEQVSWMDTAQEVWERKVGKRLGEVENWRMRRGKEFEEEARLLYTAMTGIDVVPMCGEMKNHPFIRSSYDGMTFDGSLYVEMKVPGMKVHELAQQGIVVEYYRPQLAHQALTLHGHVDEWDRKAPVHFFSYVPEIEDGALVECTTGDLVDLAAKLYPELLKFWGQVESNTPPVGEPWMQSAKRFLMAELEFAAAESAREIARAGMISLLPAGKRTERGGGVTVTRVPKFGQIDGPSASQTLNVTPDQLEPFKAFDYEAAVSALGITPEQLKPFAKETDYEAAFAALGFTEEQLRPFRAELPEQYRVTVGKNKSKRVVAQGTAEEVPAWQF